MKERARSTGPKKASCCTLPLPVEERQKVMAAWLEGIPPDIRGNVEKLNAVEIGIGMGPGCVAVSIHKIGKPGWPFTKALDRLASRADILRRCHMVMSDGQTLFFEPSKFLNHTPAPSKQRKERKQQGRKS